MAFRSSEVPARSLTARYPRSLENLRRAVRELPHVLVFDNSDLRRPFRNVAELVNGAPSGTLEPVPPWLRGVLVGTRDWDGGYTRRAETRR